MRFLSKSLGLIDLKTESVGKSQSFRLSQQISLTIEKMAVSSSVTVILESESLNYVVPQAGVTFPVVVGFRV